MVDLDRKRATAARVRRKALGIRTTSVLIRKRVWSGKRIGEGRSADTDLDLGPVKVRCITAREIASSGGRFQDEAVEVGPINQPYTSSGGGGYTTAQLDPTGDNATDIFWVLTGDIAGEYVLVHLDSAKPLRHMATLNRRRSTP